MSYSPPPAGSKSSALVQTLRFLKDPFSLIADAQKEAGDVFSIKVLGLGHWVFLGSPDLIKTMFKAPTDVLAAGEVNRKQLGFMLGTDATFSHDGDDHRERQRIVHPLLNGRGIRQHVGLIREVALRTVDGWPEGERFPILHRCHRISLDVLFETFFRESPPERRLELADLFDEFATRGLRSPLIAMPMLQIDLGPISPWGRIMRLRRRVREEFAKEIERYLAREDGGENPGILVSMIRARQRDGQALTDAQLLDETINLLFAGHETTGAILTWTIECLYSRPEILERVRQEIAEVVGEGPVEADHLEKLTYLDAVIQETMRYRPLAPMAGVRLAKQPFDVGGYTVPEGMLVAQCFPLMAKRPELFEAPDEFRPEHFHERKFKPFEWHPFGGGTRMCIGRGLAELELEVALATLVPRIDFTIAQEKVEAVRSGFFFGPSEGLQVIMEKRKS